MLAMKLFKKEQLHLLATEGFDEVNTNNSNEVCQAIRIVDGDEGPEVTLLRQLFVTVSPKLCYAVKHYVLQLKRCVGYCDEMITSWYLSLPLA